MYHSDTHKMAKTSAGSINRWEDIFFKKLRLEKINKKVYKTGGQQGVPYLV